jgi:acyl-coenzyme A synthetase/AMP-(fatty) acid ligase/acyl carrier protein
MFVTTALFNQLVGRRPDVFAPLDCLLFGGELVDPGVVRRCLAHGPPRRLLHVYGPTENTTFSTWHEVTSVPADARTVPIGRPLANTTAWVLDEHGGPLPPGVPGELFLGGDGLALHYLGAPELTARRFVPHPFDPAPGARLYRTGDRVVRRADGALEFVSRLDEQVKLRGHRIEPGEIEAALLADGVLRAAVVVVREDQPGERRLVAYIVPAEAQPREALFERLDRLLRARLPAFMIPSALVPLERLPLNPNGKLDRAALPAPAGRAARRAWVEPAPGTERLVADVWSALLDVERVGAEDRFFELGGHSLLASRVLSRLRDATGFELPLQRLFEEPTVRGLARHLDLLAWARDGQAEPAAAPGETEDLEL